MKDEDQSPRQVALCCVGELYLSRVARNPTGELRDFTFEELKTLYTNAKNAGREDAMKSIRGMIEHQLPW